MLDEMLFMSEEVVQALHTWTKQFYQEGPSKKFWENIVLLMLQFPPWSFRLEDVNNMIIKVATYLLEGLTKCSMEEFSNNFDMMLHQEHVKQLISGV